MLTIPMNIHGVAKIVIAGGSYRDDIDRKRYVADIILISHDGDQRRIHCYAEEPSAIEVEVEVVDPEDPNGTHRR